MSHYTQYLKDLIKTNLGDFISKKFGRLKTGMERILLLLEFKKLLPENIIAIEVFGMHGLWHTKDYIKHVQSLDIFELDKKYHDLSKKVFRGYPVQYFNQDSLDYIFKTDKKYNLVVADTPAGGNFYAPNGMPFFWNNLVRVTMPGGVIISNIHSDKLDDYKLIEKWIKNNSNNKPIKDIFFMPRNNSITYVVIIFE